MHFYRPVLASHRPLCCRPSNPLVEVPESPSIVSGMKYNEWQRNSGLRVLRKVLDRQKLLQTSDRTVSNTSTTSGHTGQVSSVWT